MKIDLKADAENDNTVLNTMRNTFNWFSINYFLDTCQYSKSMIFFVYFRAGF